MHFFESPVPRAAALRRRFRLLDSAPPVDCPLRLTPCPMFSLPPTTKAAKWIAFIVCLSLTLTCVFNFYAGFFPTKVVVPGEASFLSNDAYIGPNINKHPHVRMIQPQVLSELQNEPATSHPPFTPFF